MLGEIGRSASVRRVLVSPDRLGALVRRGAGRRSIHTGQHTATHALDPLTLTVVALCADWPDPVTVPGSSGRSCQKHPAQSDALNSPRTNA